MPTKEEQLLEKQLKTYRPVEGPTIRQLEWGLWWVEHRARLKRIVIIALVLINTSLLGYSLFHLIDYAYNGIIEDRQLAQVSRQEQAVNHAATLASGALPLTLGSVQVFSNTGGTYDVAATLTNPNQNWYARFDYSFLTSQDNTEPQHGFVMPGETKYLSRFLNEGARPANARLAVANIKWRRVDARQTGPITEFMREHTDIAVTGVAVQTESGGSAPLNRVNFTVTNHSPYNYWSVDLQLTATSGARVVGINRYVLEKLHSGETRVVEMLWAGTLTGGTLAVKPFLDIFDEDNYMPFDLGPGQVK